MADSLNNNSSNEIHHSKESSEAQKSCLKHAAENISQKLQTESSCDDGLCEGCSKNLLSYIFLIQDMLHGLARKFSKHKDPSSCVQCLRQESRDTEDLPHGVDFKNNNLKNEASANSNGLANDENEALPRVPIVPELKDEVQTNQMLEQDISPMVKQDCWRQESFHTEYLPHGQDFKNNHLENEALVNLSGINYGENEGMSSVPIVPELKDEAQSNQNLEQNISPLVVKAVEATSEPKRKRKVSSRRNSRRISREIKENNYSTFSENCTNRNVWQTDFLYNVSSSVEPKYIPYTQRQENEKLTAATLNKKNSSQEYIVNRKENTSLIHRRSRSDSLPLTPSSPILFFDNFCPSSMTNFEKSPGHLKFNQAKLDDFVRFDDSATESCSNYHKSDFPKLNYSVTKNTSNRIEVEVDKSDKSDYSGTESNSSPFDVDVDDSAKSDYSGTESLEREVMEVNLAENEATADQNIEEWRTLHDSFSDRVEVKNRKSSEAFVTICRNNAEALGCLVLGSSLLLSRTSKTLCVLVFDDVDPVFKEPLSSVFHVVQHVGHLKSIDERKIEYLKQMNLEKLNIWCLVQFSKCIYLNPDCLILRNCDELFQYDELSAVPDIGWPDCFNSGVFVFTPSVNTLSKLAELSQKQGQNNGGDQMLLNAYFNSWSSDIGKKLSFIYNLMQNASYTYGPALQRFGHNVKIVQFLGGSKPWEVKFSTQTGQLDDDVDVHPKHVRFFSEWINTFKIAVLKLFPQAVYTYAFDQRSVSAEDIGFALCFPAPYKNIVEKSVKPFHILPKRRVASSFYLADPSSSKTAECNAFSPTDVLCESSDVLSVEEATQKLIAIGCFGQNGKTEDGERNTKMEREIVSDDSPFDRGLPGAIIGDYQGMMAWEQGHIDYEGCDSSENIMNRLSFLIHRSM